MIDHLCSLEHEESASDPDERVLLVGQRHFLFSGIRKTICSKFIATGPVLAKRRLETKMNRRSER